MATKEKSSGLLGSFALILVAGIIIIKTSRDLAFYFDRTTIPVAAAVDIDKLRDNAITEISLDLDIKRAYGVTYLSQQEFLLIPFTGLGYKLMYVIEGPLTDKLIANLHPPFKGRVVTKDFADSWDVFDKPMKLQKIFARDRIDFPADAMVIYDAPKALPGLWGFFIFALAIVYIVYKIYSFSRLLIGKKAQPSAST